MSIHGKPRPNVYSAHHIPLTEKVEGLTMGDRRKKDLAPKHTIGDLCDSCLKNIRVKRDILPMRLKGYVIWCWVCINKHGIKPGSEHKMMSEWIIKK